MKDVNIWQHINLCYATTRKDANESKREKSIPTNFALQKKFIRELGSAFIITSNPTSRCGPLLIFKFKSSSWLKGANHVSMVTVRFCPLLLSTSTSYNARTPPSWSCWFRIVTCLMIPVPPGRHLRLWLPWTEGVFKLFNPTRTKAW